MMAINMSSDWRLTRLTMGGVRALGWGHSVTMASAHWLVASLFKLACVMAKHAIVGLPKTAALGGHGVTCNAICPSHVLTPLEELQIPETAKARGMTDEQVNRDVMLAAQPTREFITVAQRVALTAFLCSDAAANMTGAALPVDGGWTDR